MAVLEAQFVARCGGSDVFFEEDEVLFEARIVDDLFFDTCLVADAPSASEDFPGREKESLSVCADSTSWGSLTVDEDDDTTCCWSEPDAASPTRVLGGAAPPPLCNIPGSARLTSPASTIKTVLSLQHMLFKTGGSWTGPGPQTDGAPLLAQDRKQAEQGDQRRARRAAAAATKTLADAWAGAAAARTPWSTPPPQVGAKTGDGSSSLAGSVAPTGGAEPTPRRRSRAQGMPRPGKRTFIHLDPLGEGSDETPQIQRIADVVPPSCYRP